MVCQFVFGFLLVKNTTRVDAVEVGNEKFDLVVEETPTKITYIAVVDGISQSTSEYNKLSKKVYLNGNEVEYSFKEGKKVKESNTNAITPYASNWDPVTVITGYEINFAPFIEKAASWGMQLYLAHIGAAATSLINKLAKTTLNSHWSVVASTLSGDIISYIGSYASKVINVKFVYDLQKTRGLVTLNGGSVPVTGYRYANYKGKLYLGSWVSKSTGKTGGWWSSSKPYSLEENL